MSYEGSECIAFQGLPHSRPVSSYGQLYKLQVTLLRT